MYRPAVHILSHFCMVFELSPSQTLSYHDRFGVAFSIVFFLHAGAVLPGRKQTCVRDQGAASPQGWWCCHPAAAHPWGTKLPPCPGPRPLWGSQPDSRVVEADPTVVAVRVAIGATHWFQVPWASYPGPPVLGNATGVLTAIKLWKQPRISPNFGMNPSSILPPPPRLQLLLGSKSEA